MMQVFKSIKALRAALENERKKGEKIGLVPTMGALHDGHLSLVCHARKNCSIVVVSIFVNPKQFGEDEDYEHYPRCLEKDIELLKPEGVAYVFAPSVEEMWPEGNETIVETIHLSKILQGEVRPGHFCGVTTVVAKLFNIVGPHKAFFGEKDFQQLTIIRRMVEDLAFPVEIVGVPTQREADGLARSSRNALLTKEQRQAAVALSRSLNAAVKHYEKGERDSAVLQKIIRDVLEKEPLCNVESIEIRNPKNLRIVEGIIKGPIVLLLSAKFGDVRLIDQREILG